MGHEDPLAGITADTPIEQPANPPVDPKLLQKYQIPLAWRDYCAHLLIPLNECRIKNNYLPWKCEDEKHAWEKCQYEDYKRRMRLAERERQRRKEAANPSSSE